MTEPVKNTVALVVAAGKGIRAGGDTPKQYQLLNGKTVLYHTVVTFLSHERIDSVQVVINPADQALYDAALAEMSLPEPVAGGETRQESVLNGLLTLKQAGAERVLVHDAARPFVSSSEIDRVLEALDNGADGALPVLPVADTLKWSGDGEIARKTVDRKGLYRALTPQGFDLDKLIAANTKVDGSQLTDDASIAEAAGLAVHMVAGSEANFKITGPRDMERAERQYMQALGDIRTGQGFDVHSFTGGDHVMLCGVMVPHTQALAGHSDADVALHALVDAILGAIGAGDIGDHFPPSDDQWKGASSDRFLAHAGKLLSERGGMIRHLDATIICEAPKIGPHKAAMRSKVAEILGISTDRVSVKATTTEKLGFTGRGEGIAVQATATVALPLSGDN